MPKKLVPKVAKQKGAPPMATKLLNKFLVELKKSCNVTRSADKIGRTRRALYNRKNLDAKFSDAWDEALDEGIDLLAFKAQERAFDGVPKGIYFKGKKVATEYEYSDGLTKWLLSKHKPEKYGDSPPLSLGAVGGVLLIPESAGMTVEQWKAKYELSTGKAAEVIDIEVLDK